MEVAFPCRMTLRKVSTHTTYKHANKRTNERTNAITIALIMLGILITLSTQKLSTYIKHTCCITYHRWVGPVETGAAFAGISGRGARQESRAGRGGPDTPQPGHTRQNDAGRSLHSVQTLKVRPFAMHRHKLRWACIHETASLYRSQQNFSYYIYGGGCYAAF